ncbi:DUF397 domain-containing protein [Polymorphospora rubra]|uniref:DUF397 domain-containing protein n=1 Tax=Polymorphospora rubra TaxID=338584 RepID=A0A810MTI7_9ACTN|nr:DUF397 domain-containing protein [Polymorphospora rubra]BCJ63820.1 hypothetical protein Prubr_08410 [Polymorphospora rubra]
MTDHVQQESTVTGHPKGDFDLSRAVWQRAEGDASDGAVEVAFVDDLIGLRNSADPDGPVLVFTRSEWDAFVGGAQLGEFDVA